MMRQILATSAIALLVGSAAVAQQAETAQTDEQQVAQETGQQDQQQAGAEGSFVQAGEEDIFITQLIGIAVFAPADGAQGPTGGEGGMIDSAALADFEEVGQITDVMMGMDGQPRAFVIGLGAVGTSPDAMPADTAEQQDQAAADPAAGPAGTTAPAGTMAGDGMAAGTGVGREIALEAGQIQFFRDENAPQLIFAVAATGVEEMQEAQALERPAMVGGGTGPVGMATEEPAAGGWMMGRDPMMAPGVAMDGFQQVPVAEVSVDNLLGAGVYGAEMEQIGSVNDVHLGPEGQVEFVTVDVGGFLGIGTRTVAIGFDEMTVMRDAGWDDVQVHVAATQEDLEQMPEYEEN